MENKSVESMNNMTAELYSSNCPYTIYCDCQACEMLFVCYEEKSMNKTVGDSISFS